MSDAAEVDFAGDTHYLTEHSSERWLVGDPTEPRWVITQRWWDLHSGFQFRTYICSLSKLEYAMAQVMASYTRNAVNSARQEAQLTVEPLSTPDEVLRRQDAELAKRQARLRSVPN